MKRPLVLMRVFSCASILLAVRSGRGYLHVGHLHDLLAGLFEVSIIVDMPAVVLGAARDVFGVNLNIIAERPSLESVDRFRQHPDIRQRILLGREIIVDLVAGLLVHGLDEIGLVSPRLGKPRVVVLVVVQDIHQRVRAGRLPRAVLFLLLDDLESSG